MHFKTTQTASVDGTQGVGLRDDEFLEDMLRVIRHVTLDTSNSKCMTPPTDVQEEEICFFVILCVRVIKFLLVFGGS